MNKYNYTLVHIFPQTTAQNLLFIKNDYISSTVKINTLPNMHPQGYADKQKRQRKRKKNFDKDTLIKEHFKKID